MLNIFQSISSIFKKTPPPLTIASITTNCSTDTKAKVGTITSPQVSTQTEQKETSQEHISEEKLHEIKKDLFILAGYIQEYYKSLERPLTSAEKDPLSNTVGYNDKDGVTLQDAIYDLKTSTFNRAQLASLLVALIPAYDKFTPEEEQTLPYEDIPRDHHLFKKLIFLGQELKKLDTSTHSEYPEIMRTLFTEKDGKFNPNGTDTSEFNFKSYSVVHPFNHNVKK